jgi:thioredoxin reductase (NADPH)
MAEHRTKVLVLGSGAAGCTAAIYAARANLEPIIVAGMQPGGQLTITTDVENYPGFADPVQGPWLMEQMQQQAENVGARLIHDLITEVDLSKRPFVCTGDSGDTYVAGSLIVATGASAKWLGIESETRYSGFGVSACATCDGFFFRGKPVVVIGGGNTAVEEALYLANFCSKVTLVHRRHELRAEKIMQDRLFTHDKVEIVWDSVVDEILGEGGDGPLPPGVTGIRLKNVKTGALQEVSCDGVFVAIGHQPNTELFRGKLDMDDTGYLITQPDSTRTNVPGVFAAGDVQDHVFRQAVTAAGTGCMAAIEADRFLAGQDGP